MLWRVVIRRANDRGHEQVFERVFDDDLKAFRYIGSQQIIGRLLGEPVLHVRGPELVME